MNRYLTVLAIVEGSTELEFCRKLLAPYLGYRDIGFYASLIGGSGGDVRFDRVRDDIADLLKERSDIAVALFFDYYGLKSWPGLSEVKGNHTPEQIETILVDSTIKEMKRMYPAIPNIERRLFPFFIVHEFETLLFSDPEKLASELDIDKTIVEKVLAQFKNDPQLINNSVETAPSKRIMNWNSYS